MARHRWAWAAFAAVAALGARPAPGPEVLAPVVLGEHPRGRWVPPPPVREPPRPPADPTRPPGESPPAPEPAPRDPGAMARAPEYGTLPAAALNPNMYGDQFSGTGRGTLARRVDLTLVRAGGTSAADFARYLGVVDTRRYIPHQDYPDDFPALVLIDGRPLTVGRPQFTAANRVSPTPGSRPANPLFENAGVTAVLRTLVPEGEVRYVSGAAVEVDDGSLVTPHRIQVVYDISQTSLALSLPPDGGIVGRTKLSDDNNPLPRDRVILNYDYYANPVLAAGLDVHRTAVGLETTFLDRRASFEFRVPFASTLDSVSGAGGVAARGTEFGNLFTAVKGLFYQGDDLNMSAGLAVSFPTGADSVLLAFDGREFVRVENESVLAAPFVAVLYTPGDRFFAQAWLQTSFDLTGNPVSTDFEGAGAVTAGRLRDQARLSADVQVGYWVYRRAAGDGLRGLAPFFELHYNTTLTDAGRVQAPPATVIGATNKRFDEVNATVGMTALLGSNLMVMAGLVVPVREAEDRFFDYQLGVRANWFFGPTARAREEADRTGARPEALPAQTPAPPRVLQAAATAGPVALLPTTRLTAPAAGCGPDRTTGFFGDLVVLSASQGFTRLPGLPGYDGAKPTDRDGPRLSDRFYFGYDRANDLVAGDNLPGQPSQRLSRQIVGFETTFEDRLSVGLRLPFLQVDGDTDVNEVREIGDLTAVFKYAVANTPETACTLGLNVTLPTGGRGDTLAAGRPLPRGVFATPWVGAAWTSGNLFLQGTSAVLLPTSPVYPVAMFNGVGGGYWVYRSDLDRLVRGIAPVLEVHASNPVNHRGADEPLLLRTQVNLTAGLFVQFPRLAVGAAVGVPLAGKAYDPGGLLTISYQF